MKSTRQRILDILNQKPGCTAAELSRVLQLTQADIRHHLSNMLTEGLIVESGHDRAGRRGRPARKFRIANVNRENFDLLLSSLLEISQQDQISGGEDAFFERVAAQLVGDDIPGGHLAQRLSGTVEQLKEIGYQARWEAHADAPQLILEHCPFERLHPRHPELVRLDASLMETLLGEPVQRIDTLTPDEDGDRIYLVGRIDSA